LEYNTDTEQHLENNDIINKEANISNHKEKQIKEYYHKLNELNNNNRDDN